jgi:hypothetical protein
MGLIHDDVAIECPECDSDDWKLMPRTFRGGKPPEIWTQCALCGYVVEDYTMEQWLDMLKPDLGPDDDGDDQ